MKFLHFKTFSFYPEANIALGLLQNNGINCYLRDEISNVIDNRLSIANGGIKLFVEQNAFEGAAKILAETEQAYVRTLQCENCFEFEIAICEETRVAKSFWEALKNRVLFGSHNFYKREYRCMACDTAYNN